MVDPSEKLKLIEEQLVKQRLEILGTKERSGNKSRALSDPKQSLVKKSVSDITSYFKK